MTIFLQVLQVLAGLLLIVAIMFQTTKSESGGGMGGMGWGVIGGKSTSSLGRWGNEEYIARITTGVAVGFLALSLLVAIVSMK